jgi:hypothetical protein
MSRIPLTAVILRDPDLMMQKFCQNHGFISIASCDESQGDFFWFFSS